MHFFVDFMEDKMNIKLKIFICNFTREILGIIENSIIPLCCELAEITYQAYFFRMEKK